MENQGKGIFTEHKKKCIAGIIAVVLIIAILAGILAQVSASYTTDTSPDHEVFPNSDNNYTYIVVTGPSGTSKLKVTAKKASGESWTNNTTRKSFKTSSKKLTLTGSVVSSNNPYNVSLKTTSVSTTQNSDGNYIYITFNIQYTVPAHEIYSTQSFDCPNLHYSASGTNATHSTSAVTLTRSITINVENMGVLISSNGNRQYGTSYTLTHIKKSYTLSFNVNGGNTSVSSITRTCGTTVDLSSYTTSRNGYTFAGWYSAASGGTKYTSYTLCNASATLYAHWTANPYTITYDANGGSGSMNTTSATYMSSVTLSANKFTRSGYSFAGWSTKSGATTATYTDGSSFVYGTASDMTLYAVWASSSYFVDFDPNGGSGTTYRQAIASGKSTALEACTFTREGYTFAGWSADENASIVTYTDEQAVTDLADVDDSITLYAVWRKSDGNFDLSSIIDDDSMFKGDQQLVGGDGTKYNKNQTDSKYAHIDESTDPGYFTDIDDK